MNDTIVSKHIIATIENKEIWVYTKRKNNRTYKNRCYELGKIIYHSKTRHWSYMQLNTWAIGYETMGIITNLLYRLDNGLISCDFEKGEFIL